MRNVTFWGIVALIAALAVFSCPTDEDSSSGEHEKTTILDDKEFLLEAQPPSQDLAALFAALPSNLSNSWKIWGHKNPLFTGFFGADPNVLIYNDRLYVYMSNDTLEYDENGGILAGSSYGLGIQGIRIVSSADLANWTDHGAVNIVGPANTNPLVEDEYWKPLLNIPGVDRSWAPTAAWKIVSGKPKFFLYWPNGGNGVGVVTANSPVGPWSAPLKKLLIDRDTPNCANVEFLFDPSVFIDDDGAGYLYFGGGGSGRDTGNARRVKLGSNMISLAADPEKWSVPYLFEASDMKKIKGRYYFSYSANSAYTSGGSIVYVTPLDPMSGFGANPNSYNPPIVLTTAATQLGSNDTNTHHAMFEFKGETYMVYHTQKAAEAMGVGRMRSASIDRMPINPNGTIDPVVMTRKGVDQVGKFDPYVVNQAETIGIQGGVYTRPLKGAGNGTVVTSIDTGDWLAVYGVDFGAEGATKFAARVRTPAAPTDYVGAIELRLDPSGAGITSDTGNLTPTNTARITGGTVIGRVQFKAKPGEEGKYAVTAIDFDTPVTGAHDLVFVFYSSLGVHPETIVPDSRHKNGFEFDEWQFFKTEE
jgi:arabinoxylan arabinofuranohydrolase